MEKYYLTETIIEKLKPAPKGKRYDVGDLGVPNLIVRVGPNGSKVFNLQARFGDSSQPTRRPIGHFPLVSLSEARSVAVEWNQMRKTGIDPKVEIERTRSEEVIRTRSTFRSVMVDYLALLPHRKFNRHADEDIRKLKRHFLDEAKNPWIDKPISDVTALEIQEVIDEIKSRAPASARDAFGIIRAFFKWAMNPRRADAYRLLSDPIRHLTPSQLNLDKNIRSRHLSAEEIKVYLLAAHETPYPFGPFAKALLFTVQRKLDVGEARWSEMDLKNRLWIIPEERYKSQADQLVPLSDQMMGLLEDLKATQSERHGDYIFSSSNGQRPMNSYSKSFRMFAEKAMSIMERRDPLFKFEKWVLHDTRRTGRTGFAKLRIDDNIAEMVLGHGKEGLERVYNQYRHQDEMREALAAWGDHLAILMRDELPSDVVWSKKAIAGEPAQNHEGVSTDPAIVWPWTPIFRDRSADGREA
ncbi:tyrosine-type recombinase/integrase [Rhizobium tumorigenes]|uniref:tyrosine-type recombinase/integrase n=1 Tax=Rhizobium tumorigenes TaxID=2041385 RepID=UPI00241CCEC7|nr:site-specific integrase [Rhizobium tumorigenes]WFR99555.1 tyrosine-type recombinase/integrase [Rhizobium tumorigenes]